MNFKEVEKTKGYERAGDSISGLTLLNTSEDEANAGDPNTAAVLPGVVVGHHR